MAKKKAGPGRPLGEDGKAGGITISLPLKWHKEFPARRIAELVRSVREAGLPKDLPISKIKYLFEK